ncbi:hypothetical protein AO062_28705 [Variovorax boronicumulans]|nr:hypothetical protein AO062_28705 [Variovorax boronicumulans]
MGAVSDELQGVLEGRTAEAIRIGNVNACDFTQAKQLAPGQRMALPDVNPLSFVHCKNEIGLLTHLRCKLARTVGLEVDAAFGHEFACDRICLVPN